MNKLIRLSQTGIEYGDYAWNFASGCGNNSDGKCNSGGFKCWAYPITQRFAGHYPNGFRPTIYPEALLSPLYLKKPSRILCAFMGDLFWDCPEFDPDRKNILRGFTEGGSSWEDISLKRILYYVIESCPQHTFIFLTKQPQNLAKFQFPDNCYVGVTATTFGALTGSLYYSLPYLADIQAKVKYISFEPLLESVSGESLGIAMQVVDWLIIGAQTKPYRPPRIEWVSEIVEAADKAGIPVFLKDNLRMAGDVSMQVG
ncbi:hypothetical protein LCGC14_1342710 [marine sediment metagenome]|uniref:DUF5131 family protein n=1 Tax=marine sediment metagenome TaxID=412755 RepID=A0A0F9KD54_9ZZZZ